MKTAVNLSNRTPHAALQNGTPYKALYGKGAYLGHLRVIGPRAFVYEEVHTNKLEHRVGKAGSSDSARKASPTGSTTLRRDVCG